MSDFYRYVALFKNGDEKLTFSDKTPDFVSGFFLASRILLNNCEFYVMADGTELYKLKDIDKLGDRGGYIIEKNITTDDAMECADSEDPCQFRMVRPDDGTEAVWIFDHDESDGARWNLITTDNLKDFIYGFYSMFKFFDRDMWDYILDRPLASEGSISSWNTLADGICADKINQEQFYKAFIKVNDRK